SGVCSSCAPGLPMTRSAVSGCASSSGCHSCGHVVHVDTSLTVPLKRALVAQRANVHAMSALVDSELMPSAVPLGDACNTDAAIENATESPTTSTRPGFGAIGFGAVVDVEVEVEVDVGVVTGAVVGTLALASGA